MEKNIECACPFCDQTIMTNGDTFDSREDKEENAIKSCSCDEAVAMTTAMAVIADMFGDSVCKDYSKVRELIISLAKAVIDGILQKISVNVSYCTQVTIAASKKNTLTIKDTYKNTRTREI